MDRGDLPHGNVPVRWTLGQDFVVLARPGEPALYEELASSHRQRAKFPKTRLGPLNERYGSLLVRWWEAGLWGLVGGGALEAIDLLHLVHTSDGKYQWPKGGRRFWRAYKLAAVIRIGLGALAVLLVQQSTGVDNSVSAAITGSGAVGFLEHLLKGRRNPSDTAP